MTKTHPNQSRGILISLTILKNTCLFAAFPYIRVPQTAAQIWSKDSFFKSAPLIPMASTNAFHSINLFPLVRALMTQEIMRSSDAQCNRKSISLTLTREARPFLFLLSITARASLVRASLVPRSVSIPRNSFARCIVLIFEI